LRDRWGDLEKGRLGDGETWRWGERGRESEGEKEMRRGEKEKMMRSPTNPSL